MTRGLDVPYVLAMVNAAGTEGAASLIIALAAVLPGADKGPNAAAGKAAATAIVEALPAEQVGGSSVS